MAKLEDLVVQQTTDQIFDAAITFLSNAGFPVTSWGETSSPRRLIRAFSQALSDATSTVASIAQGGYLDLASGDWLELLADSLFSIQRIKAQSTEGLFTYTASTVGATWAAGDLIVTDVLGNQFTNPSSVTVVAGGTATFPVVAVTPGSGGNIANGSTLTIVRPNTAGVRVTNPVVGGTGTWVTTSGRDQESDVELRSRCRARWSTLGAGGTVDAIVYWALSAGAASITKAYAYPDDAGAVRVILGSNSGTPDPADVTLAKTVLETKRTLCSSYIYSTATAKTVYVGGPVYVRAAARASAEAKAAANLSDLIKSTPMGGVVHANAIISAIASVPGVVSVGVTNELGALYTQTADLQLAPYEVATLTNALIWSSV